MKIIVTGGSGFIGSHLIHRLIEQSDHEVLNLDKLTYAANPLSLAAVEHHPRYQFRHLDLAERTAVEAAIETFQPDGVIHLAAESHVDRSIDDAEIFIESNVLGTQHLLDACRRHLDQAPGKRAAAFRFVHVSTDEVYGELGESDPPFTESSRYAPRSPYAASKAAADHLVRAWTHTYEFPAIITHCGNNYGPRQFPEKLIPHLIQCALAGNPLPIYGDGRQIRDWLHVEDHIDALLAVFARGEIDSSYHIGTHHEVRNLDLAHTICRHLDELVPDRRPADLESFAELITFVADRPGHDRRYALDTRQITRDLGWTATRAFGSSLRETIQWYLANPDWLRACQTH